MTARFWAVVALLVAWAALVAWNRRREGRVGRGVRTPHGVRGARDQRGRDHEDGIDHEELERAEREVRDMEQGPRGRPLDEVVGDDWGPGTPKPPYV